MYIPVKPISMIQYNNYQTTQHLSYRKPYPNQKGAQTIVNSETLTSCDCKPVCFHLTLGLNDSSWRQSRRVLSSTLPCDAVSDTTCLISWGQSQLFPLTFIRINFHTKETHECMCKQQMSKKTDIKINTMETSILPVDYTVQQLSWNIRKETWVY